MDEENYPVATNFQYVDPDEKEKPIVKKLFMNNVNSYHGSVLVKTILNENECRELDSEKAYFEIVGTRQESDDCGAVPDVTILNPNKDSFFDSVIACDIIIYDISQEISQLNKAKKFIKYFENQLENTKIGSKKFILISTIMTWAQTPQQDEKLNDSSYRKRRPHHCFVNHLILERDVINLQKKFKDQVESLVICPGIIFGGRQDILHFLYKKCYFNHIQLEIFEPATNYLPMIYLEDFVKIMVMNLHQSPDSKCEYILAVQPESLSAKDIVEILSSAAGGPEMRIKICEQSEIFLMDQNLMTVRTISYIPKGCTNLIYFIAFVQQRVFNHLTLNIRVESEFLSSFDFIITGNNFELKAQELAKEFHQSRKLKPIKVLIDGSPFAYQWELAEMISKYYSLHTITKDCFLENTCQRLVR